VKHGKLLEYKPPLARMPGPKFDSAKKMPEARMKTGFGRQKIA
jgi:hypothetical protein